MLDFLRNSNMENSELIKILEKENSALQRELLRVIDQRDKLSAEVISWERKEIIYDTWGHAPMKLSMYCDRLVAERNQFEYYATLYKDLMLTLVKKYGCNTPDILPYEKPFIARVSID